MLHADEFISLTNVAALLRALAFDLTLDSLGF
jgi:hypothetical protein